MVKKLVSLYKIILWHKCPSCSKGDIYSSMLGVADKCNNCALPLAEHDAGDGPAFFVMFFVGIIITALAFVTDVLFVIPFWAHIFIWSIVATILSVYLLRVVKSLLICLQYKNNVLDFCKRDKK